MNSHDRRPPHSRMPWRYFLVVAALLICSSLSVRAEAILSLHFDDPNGLIKTKPEGISKITADFNGKTATIASGTGGRALPYINAGPAAEHEGKPADVNIQILSEPKAGMPSFLRARLEASSVTRTAGVVVIPGSVASSLSAFVTYKDGFAVLDGGFDFFVRATNEGGAAPNLGIWAECGSMGFGLSNAERALPFRLGCKEKLFNLDGSKTGSRNVLSGYKSEGGMDSGVVYHAAFVFRTSADQSLSIDFCLRSGTGPMNAADSTVTSISNFWLLEGGQPATESKISILIRRTEHAQTLDVGAVRIFKPAPAVFPGIDGKE